MGIDETVKIENRKDFIRIMGQLMTALEDREIDAEEGALLCQTAAKLIERCRPLFCTWWQRAILNSASNALNECAHHLDKSDARN